MADVLVVGAGLAGARVVTLLRAAGFEGGITLAGAEADPPYDRPPLTKDPGAEVDLRPAMGIDVWGAADEVLLGVPARGLAVAAGAAVVDLAAAGEVAADAVVVATGASPIRPAGWAGPGVHLLHTRADAATFWGAVQPGTRLAVVGGGWIGCEVAATAAGRGARVTVLEGAERLLAGRVPGLVSDRIAQWLAAAGVEARTGCMVTAVRDGEGGPRVILGATSAGAPEVLAPDLVLVALGVRPATGWLGGCGVAVSGAGAVLVDPWGRSSVPGVFAVGDAAARWSPRAGRHLEGGHWSGAMDHPAALVPALQAWLTAGHRDADQRAWSAPLPGAVPDPVPSLFSHVGEHVLLAVGDVGAAGEVAWDEDEHSFAASVRGADGRLLGACGSGRPRAIMAARRALRDAAPAGPVAPSPPAGA
ncbi:MAG TPA: NAD(P)/FAD-dependent oxidoreductase [Candidatus Nanopelagicales bacterium]